MTLLVVALVVAWSLVVGASPGLALIAIAVLLIALEHARPHHRAAAARDR